MSAGGDAPKPAAAAPKGGAKGGAKTDDSGRSTFAPASAPAVASACAMLGVSEAALVAALTTKEVVAGRERYTTVFSPAQVRQ